MIWQFSFSTDIDMTIPWTHTLYNELTGDPISNTFIKQTNCLTLSSTNQIVSVFVQFRLLPWLLTQNDVKLTILMSVQEEYDVESVLVEQMLNLMQRTLRR